MKTLKFNHEDLYPKDKEGKQRTKLRIEVKCQSDDIVLTSQKFVASMKKLISRHKIISLVVKGNEEKPKKLKDFINSKGFKKGKKVVK